MLEFFIAMTLFHVICPLIPHSDTERTRTWHEQSPLAVLSICLILARQLPKPPIGCGWFRLNECMTDCMLNTCRTLINVFLFFFNNSRNTKWKNTNYEFLWWTRDSERASRRHQRHSFHSICNYMRWLNRGNAINSCVFVKCIHLSRIWLNGNAGNSLDELKARKPLCVSPHFPPVGSCRVIKRRANSDTLDKVKLQRGLVELSPLLIVTLFT